MKRLRRVIESLVPPEFVVALIGAAILAVLIWQFSQLYTLYVLWRG